MAPARKQFVERGQRFGRGVVVDPEIRLPHSRHGTQRGARLRCDCGTLYKVALASLLRGHSQSCGCLCRDSRRDVSLEHREALRARSTSHGLAHHPLYQTWHGAVARCHNPEAPNWKYYGARGVTVCPEWHDVATFIAWINANLGPRPAGCTLDRIDVDGNYEPGNVQWATASEQIANRRPSAASGQPRPWLRRLTDAEVEEIRQRYALGGATHRSLAAEYGVSHGTIGRYLNGTDTTCAVIAGLITRAHGNHR